MLQYIGTNIVQAEREDRPAPLTGVYPGYKIVYLDGYTSWSPADAFEGAYREFRGLTFGMAIEALKKGLRVARSGWNGKGMWLELQVPDACSKMTLPYIWMKTADHNNVPWLASQTDMLSEDWTIVEETSNG